MTDASNSRESRADFRVVFDGVRLDDGQRERVAIAVQKAALEALAASDVRLDQPIVIGHGGFKLRPEWRGIWILDGPAAADLGPQVEQLGFMR
jgi:hypothetical protein